MPEDTSLLERRLAEARSDAKSLAAQNEALNRTLREARSQLVQLRDDVVAMTQPPLTVARVLGVAGELVDVQQGGRQLRVGCSPEASPDGLEPGDRVLLNDALTITAIVDAPDSTGDLGTVIELIGDLAVITTGQEQSRVRLVGHALAEPPEAGDTLMIDGAARLGLAVVPRVHAEELVLEEKPDVSYADIGGLGPQIEQIRDAVELPFLHRDRYQAYGLKPPKGILLYGPPGCGKTMIAKAVAKSLGEQLGDASQATFINIKGPELLNKFVGETERQIRQVFERARTQATSGVPVIVFFDEMDALFRTRGSGVSSDVETTIVPQLLTEIDGVEGLDNVIIIGASNREDMIDPAILRPGRLDVKIKLDRPSGQGAAEILARYLGTDVPLAPVDVDQRCGDRDATRSALIAAAVDEVYAATDANRFLEVTYASGDKEVLMFADFASGAMLHNIVDRAKKIAIKDEIAGGPGGVSEAGLRQAAREEFAENEDLPNTTNPDDWARVSGRKGERITFIRTLVGRQSREVEPD